MVAIVLLKSAVRGWRDGGERQSVGESNGVASYIVLYGRSARVDDSNPCLSLRAAFHTLAVPSFNSERLPGRTHSKLAQAELEAEAQDWRSRAATEHRNGEEVRCKHSHSIL